MESRDARINDIWEQYELTPGSAREMKREEYQEMNQLKKAVLDLKNEIRSLGSVNVNAIEEFKEISERHSFLKGQHDDLVESEKALLGVIDDLDAGMRRQFEENFVKIQTEFDKAFRQLFGGGHGKLELVEGAAGQAAQDDHASLRRREGSHGYCPAFCDPEPETLALLSLRRDRGGSG